MDIEELYKRYKEVEYRVCKLEYTLNGMDTKIKDLEWKTRKMD
jgi:hypothetical protein